MKQASRPKPIAIAAAMATLFFWYSPWVSWQQQSMFGHSVENVFQSGEHIGGRAYLILVAAVAQAVFAWVQKYQFAAMTAGFALLIAVTYLPTIGTNVAYGMIALLAVNGFLAWFYWRQHSHKQ